MKKKNIYFFVLFSVLLLIYPVYLYFGGQLESNNKEIIFIKSNLENYRIIPEDKGGINTPCLEILDCKNNDN